MNNTTAPAAPAPVPAPEPTGAAPTGTGSTGAAPAAPGTIEGMTFRPDGRFWIVYACLMTVQFLAAMYHTVVATALPTIIGDLGGVAHMSWAVTAYTLGQTLAMPVYGKVGDALGRKPLYLLAIALFVGGSALCGTAAGMLGFTVFRFLQGLGGAGLMICSQAIAGDLIPPRVRGKYLAPMGAMFGIAAILGPLLGGWLTDWLGWRSIFWFFLPFGTPRLDRRRPGADHAAPPGAAEHRLGGAGPGRPRRHRHRPAGHLGRNGLPVEPSAHRVPARGHDRLVGGAGPGGEARAGPAHTPADPGRPHLRRHHDRLGAHVRLPVRHERLPA